MYEVQPALFLSLENFEGIIYVHLICRFKIWCPLIFSFIFIILSACGETKSEIISVYIDSFKRDHLHTASVAAGGCNCSIL